MKVIVDESWKIFALQEEFSVLFPYLRIEFFSSKGGRKAGKKDLIMPSRKTLAECRTIHNNTAMAITPDMTVYDLEKNFCDVYGLEIQVLRKSGRIWLKTTLTDGWTLDEQNRQGEALSKNVA